MRGVRLTQAVCQPVCLAPLYLCPQVHVEGCRVACQPPCVRCGEEGPMMVEQTFTVRVPITIGADAALGCARFFCVKGGTLEYENRKNAALPPQRGL